MSHSECGLFTACFAAVCWSYVLHIQLGEEKRPLERPRRRWEDNIKMDLQEMGCGDMDWIELAQDRDRWLALVNAVMNQQVP